MQARCGEQAQGIERHFLHCLVARHCGYPQEPQTAVIPCRGMIVPFPCMQGLHRHVAGFSGEWHETMIPSSYNAFSSQWQGRLSGVVVSGRLACKDDGKSIIMACMEHGPSAYSVVALNCLWLPWETGNIWSANPGGPRIRAWIAVKPHSPHMGPPREVPHEASHSRVSACFRWECKCNASVNVW